MCINFQEICRIFLISNQLYKNKDFEEIMRLKYEKTKKLTK